MMIQLDPAHRYDMPASFGPSMVPHRTEVSRAESLVLSTTTDRASVQALVPSHFSVPDEPSLVVAHMAYHDVDYLGGRSYNEIVVSVGASVEREGAIIAASLALVLWVDQPGAMMAGREFMGLPKILGQISDLTETDDALEFRCAEYDVPIVTGGASALAPVEGDRLQRLNARAGQVQTFGWKYIARAGGGSDLDYPLLNTMRWTYEQAWTGEGQFAFAPSAFRDAPMSNAAVTQLAQLPIKAPVRAFRGIGRAVIDRTATRRI